MLNRWDTSLEDINVSLQQLKSLERRFSFVKKGRGRKPKQNVEDYICLIVLKEFDSASLRNAENYIDKKTCLQTKRSWRKCF
jgi:hypothetical protein